jgi:DNA-binding transcriptional MerR regulator
MSMVHVYGAQLGAIGPPMPATETATQPKPKRETWLDLLPPGAPRPPLEELMTREELLEELQRRGVDVTETALVAWEKRGFAPRAIRSRRASTSVALYPEFAIPALVQLRTLHEQGYTLKKIAPLVRMWADNSILWTDPWQSHQAAIRGPLVNFAQAVASRLGEDVASIRVILQREDGSPLHVHELPAAE